MTTPKPRGFAAMAPDARAAISRKGGLAAHAAGTAHEFTSEEARSAGKKGGLATHARRTSAEERTGDLFAAERVRVDECDPGRPDPEMLRRAVEG